MMEFVVRVCTMALIRIMILPRRLPAVGFLRDCTKPRDPSYAASSQSQVDVCAEDWTKRCRLAREMKRKQHLVRYYIQDTEYIGILTEEGQEVITTSRFKGDRQGACSLNEWIRSW